MNKVKDYIETRGKQDEAVLWEMPAVKVMSLYGLPFGAAVADVSGRLMCAVQQVLIDEVGVQLRHTRPDVSPDEVSAACDTVVERWLDLLNQSIGEPALALTPEEIVDLDYQYSFEFGFLALEYGRILAASPDFVAKVLVAAVEDSVEEFNLSSKSAAFYVLLPWIVQRVLRADLRFTLPDVNAAIFEWCASAELDTVHPENRTAYIKLYSEAYPLFLETISHIAPMSLVQEAATIEEENFRWELRWHVPRRFPVGLAVGGVLSLLLFLWATAVLPALALIAWLPLVVGGFLDWVWRIYRQRYILLEVLQNLPSPRLVPVQPPSNGLEELAEALKRQVDNLCTVQDIILSLGTTLDLNEIIGRLLGVLTEELGFDRAMLLLVDEARQVLNYGDVSHPADSHELQLRMENLQLPLDTPDLVNDPLLSALMQDETILLRDESQIEQAGRLSWIFCAQKITACLVAPLKVGERLIGVVVVDNGFTGTPIDEADRRLLSMVSNNMAIAMDNARLYSRTDEALEARVSELRMQQQIDRELTASLDLERVMKVTIDWALRFTNATAGSVALYNAEEDTLIFIDAYGYPDIHDLRRHPLPLEAAGPAGRVVHTGQLQFIPNVAEDPDYLELSPDICSQVLVPIKLEGEVVGVLSLESTRSDTFGEPQLGFAERLADRAAVAIVNTRLYTETQREREKLSIMLDSTAEGVIVVGPKGLLELVNPPACAIFGLDETQDYQGSLLADVVGGWSAVFKAYAQAVGENQPFFEEIQLDNGRFYYLSVLPVKRVGWVIVLQDITHFKEIDRLKSELLATVSHDLKNPLSVMSGYVELLNIHITRDEKSQHYLDRIRDAIDHMGNLINDLLEMARIESGIQINLHVVDASRAIWEIVDTLHTLAEQKDIFIVVDVDSPLPILADPQRLRQILLNLVGNAVKYTQIGGEVKIVAEVQPDGFVRISVIDNGLGIAPENHDNVFSRFYRERRPETQDVEGTGLGLSIAKGLVEAHGGEIGFTSDLSVGSTFYFTIPHAPNN